MTTTSRALCLTAATVLAAVFAPLATGGMGGDPVLAQGPAPGDEAMAFGSLGRGPSELRGAAAASRLAALGIDDVVARRSGIDAAELLTQLLHDPHLFVTRDGMVGAAEPALPDPDGAAPSVATAEADTSLPPDVFALHSRRSSARVVYLDLDGHVTEGRHWNNAYGLSAIVSAPYDTDGDPASVSRDEQARIVQIWEQVAEDFAPFDVDVTTADPGIEGLRRTRDSDPAFGVRVVVTSSDWYGPRTGTPIGGLALLNVFGASSDQPAFVFAGNLGGSAAYVAEAASHEAGHTFGLFHDGAGSSSYSTGHGDWAPIMGVGYGKAITQWSRGEYPSATNQQDDLAAIVALGGLAPDDRPDPAAPEPLAYRSRTAGVLGIGDRDVFTVTVGAGQLSVALRPGATASNLHASVTILAGGTPIAAATPDAAAGWSASADPVVAAGTYTIEVAPTGWLSASDGFTSYASAGAYRLDVAGVAPAGDPVPGLTVAPTARLQPVPPVRLVDTRTGLGGSARLAPGHTIEVQISGREGVPATATAAVVTLTAVQPAEAGFLTAHPCGSDPIRTSTVNYAAGQVIANSTIATLDAHGRFCVFTSADTDVLVDLTGWLGPTGTARFLSAGPIRVADTRSGLAGSRLTAGATLTLDLRSVVPPGTTAVAANVTAVGADVESTAALQRGVRATVIASGGIGSLDHLRALHAAGVRAAVCGRALYSGAFTLAEAFAASEGR